nr:GNAT family N-acetyltransferase [Liquorilactobacillus capillatus]
MQIENAGFSSDEAATRESMLSRIQTIPDTFIVAYNKQQEPLGYVVGPASGEKYISDELFEHTQANSGDDKYQTILSLAVSPDYQGHGIASKLLTQLAEVAREQGRAYITLTCLEKLIPFYEKNGYLLEGVAESQHANEVWYNMTYKL